MLVEQDNQQGAMFNTGLATAMEVRKLLNECNFFARVGKFTEWYATQLILIREVSCENRYSKYESAINTALTNAKTSISGWQPDIPAKSIEAYQKLHELETEIRRAIKGTGMGMPDKEDDEGL